MHSDKRLFIGLCAAVWFINTWMAGAATLSGIRLGLGISLISVPVWALIGWAFSGIAIFLFRVAKVNVTRLSLWQKADIGLALAVVFKPALGIAF